jgi:hypothetical protein
VRLPGVVNQLVKIWVEIEIAKSEFVTAYRLNKRFGS